MAPRLQEDGQSGTSVCLCFPPSYLQRFTWPFGWLVEERTSAVLRSNWAMDASHIVVGALTAVTVGLLVWIEIRSRRNRAAEKAIPPVTGVTLPPGKNP